MIQATNYTTFVRSESQAVAPQHPYNTAKAISHYRHGKRIEQVLVTGQTAVKKCQTGRCHHHH